MSVHFHDETLSDEARETGCFESMYVTGSLVRSHSPTPPVAKPTANISLFISCIVAIHVALRSTPTRALSSTCSVLGGVSHSRSSPLWDSAR